MSSLVTQMVKNLPLMQDMRVRSLGQEDPLEEGMATHSSISCLENPINKGVWQAKVHRATKSGTQLKQLSTHTQGAALAAQMEQRVACSLGITMWAWEMGRG